jgi:transposase InsO family protein
MNREVHVRFWESAGLRCPAPLDYLHNYRDRDDALLHIQDFLERIYNQERLHSALGYQAPAAYEAEADKGSREFVE